MNGRIAKNLRRIARGLTIGKPARQLEVKSVTTHRKQHSCGTIEYLTAELINAKGTTRRCYRDLKRAYRRNPPRRAP